mgnify:FL=1
MIRFCSRHLSPYGVALVSWRLACSFSASCPHLIQRFGPTKCFSSFLGADINTQASDSASALYEASKNGHVHIVEFLLSQGADANKANKDGLLPLHIAAKKGICE